MNFGKSRSSMNLRASSCMTASSLSRTSTTSKTMIRVPSTKQLPIDFFGPRTRKFSSLSLQQSICTEEMAFTFMAVPRSPIRSKPVPIRRPYHRPAFPFASAKPTQIMKTRRRYDLKLKSPQRTFLKGAAWEFKIAIVLDICVEPPIIYLMVILSAGICDKIGKILLSRQFGVVPKRLL